MASRATLFFESLNRATDSLAKTFYVSAAVGVLLFLTSGCVAPMAQIQASVSQPKKADSRKVAIVANASDDNSGASDLVAEQIRALLKEQGYTVVSSDEAADLVILPFFTLLKPGQDLPAGSYRRLARTAFFESSVSGGLLSGNSGQVGRSLLDTQSSIPEESRLGLMVTALTKDAWSAIVPDAQNVPSVWQVTALTVAPVGKEASYSQLLVAAATSYFGKETNGTVEVKLTPTKE